MERPQSKTEEQLRKLSLQSLKAEKEKVDIYYCPLPVADPSKQVLIGGNPPTSPIDIPSDPEMAEYCRLLDKLIKEREQID